MNSSSRPGERSGCPADGPILHDPAADAAAVTHVAAERRRTARTSPAIALEPSSAAKRGLWVFEGLQLSFLVTQFGRRTLAGHTGAEGSIGFSRFEQGF